MYCRCHSPRSALTVCGRTREGAPAHARGHGGETGSFGSASFGSGPKFPYGKFRAPHLLRTVDTRAIPRNEWAISARYVRNTDFRHSRTPRGDRKFAAPYLLP